jgi:hypothetical protein
MNRIALTGLLVALLNGCAMAPEDGSREPIRPSTEEGKEDVNLGAITMRDSLQVGEEAQDEFTADLQFFGYQFGGAAGAEVMIEITQRGTARDLDTTLFVYGPQVTNASDEIAFDDNSGWGDQSRIDSLVLPAEGSYLIVVGTIDGRGRGQFNLALTCLSDDCQAEAIELSCEDFQDLVDDCSYECVDEYLAESDWGYDDCPNGICPVDEDTIDECFYYCTADADVLESHRDYVCGNIGDWQRRPDWCDEAIDEFIAGPWASCPAEIEKLSPSDFEWDDWP